jgi:hypothetical protein
VKALRYYDRTGVMRPVVVDELTGFRYYGTEPATGEVIDREGERRLVGQLFNGVWLLLEKEDRTEDDDDRMLHMAPASRYHWGQVGAPENIARGEWQCSRVYAVLGRSEPSLHHARRRLQVCQADGLADFDLAFACEALARAHAVGGESEQARSMIERAVAAIEEIRTTKIVPSGTTTYKKRSDARPWEVLSPRSRAPPPRPVQQAPPPASILSTSTRGHFRGRWPLAEASLWVVATPPRPPQRTPWEGFSPHPGRCYGRPVREDTAYAGCPLIGIYRSEL